MLSRFVEEGSKIELRALQRGLEEKGAESTAKVYQSRVLQILSEDMCARNLEEEEIQALEKNSPYELQPGLPLKHSVIVDISGGGLRFVSTQRYEPGSLILCSYHLVKDGEQKKYEVVGKVLAVRELEKRKGTFEHRVQYYNLDVNTREEIIRFIFEEERKSRKKERLD